jgi:hypothetical protein
MLIRRPVYLVLPIIMFVMNEHVSACTVYSAARGEKILAAKNMDWDNLDTRIFFIPPSAGKYGRVYVGVEVPEGFCNTSGMNDQGLWYAGASLPERTDVRNHYNKPRNQGELCERAMEECATVEEVIELYTEYWEPWWDGHSMFADRHGNSVVIEFGDKDVVFIRRRGDYQVMTNFYLADSSNARWYNCYRYQMADYKLKNSDEISIGLFRDIADAVHQEGLNPTILTTVHNLTSSEIYIYNFFNYDEVVRFNLQEELKKGEGYYALPELFSQVSLRAPALGEVVSASSVTFEWNGDAESYQLYCSTDPGFNDTVPLEVVDAPRLALDGLTLCTLPLGLLLIGGIWQRRRKLLALVAALILLSLVSVCDLIPLITSPYAPSIKEHRVTIENLQPATLYYWKVVALGPDGINSESMVQAFTTEN